MTLTDIFKLTFDEIGEYILRVGPLSANSSFYRMERMKITKKSFFGVKRARVELIHNPSTGKIGFSLILDILSGYLVNVGYYCDGSGKARLSRVEAETGLYGTTIAHHSVKLKMPGGGEKIGQYLKELL